MSSDRQQWWGMAHWDDDTIHGCSIVSPGFDTEGAFRGWAAQARIAHSRKPGFLLSAWLRRWTVDATGKSAEGFPTDSPLIVREAAVPREKHERFIEEAAAMLKTKSVRAIRRDA